MAASTRIGYNSASALGGSYVAAAIRQLVAANNNMQLALRVLAEVTANGASPENLEGSPEFGVDAGKAAAFQAQVSLIATQLQTVTGGEGIPQLWQG